MSILSSERFYSGSMCLEVVHSYDAVLVSFFPYASSQSSTTTAYTTIRDGYNQIINANPYAHASSASATMHHVLGYKFFMSVLPDGQYVLRALKKQVSYAHVVSSNTLDFTSENDFAEWVPCRPSDITYSVQDAQMLGYILTKVLSQAASVGIYLSQPFKEIVNGYNGIVHQQMCPALDWLAYPLIREVDSVAMARNLIDSERDLICPNGEPLKFKELVEHYYGTSTGKMLEEIWKVLTIGGDYKRTQFAVGRAQEQMMGHFLKNATDVLSIHSDHVMQIGNRCLQTMVFTLGPAIHAKFGFDYLYQFLPMLRVDTKAAGVRPSTYGILGTEYFLKAIDKLSVFLSPKKIIQVLSQCKLPAEVHYFEDTMRMLSDYDSVDKIPKSIKDQFPNGLCIDFKFKELKEMHDKVSTQYTIIKAEASKKEIPVHPLYGMLDGMQRDGLRLVVPKSTSDLAIWGKLLNICVASYGDRAAAANTLILGVEQAGQIKYCIEFKCIIIPIPTGDNVGQVCSDDPFAQISEAGFTRMSLPRLIAKEFVNPQDQDIEQYYMPAVIQFRAERNGSPSKEDKDLVEALLINWVSENLDRFKEMGKGIFESSDTYNYEIRNIHGVADQLIIAPGQYNDIRLALADDNNR